MYRASILFLSNSTGKIGVTDEITRDIPCVPYVDVQKPIFNSKNERLVCSLI